MNKSKYEYLANQIFMACLEVHKELGPGLLESVYQYALMKEFKLKNIAAQYQVKVPLFYGRNYRKRILFGRPGGKRDYP